MPRARRACTCARPPLASGASAARTRACTRPRTHRDAVAPLLAAQAIHRDKVHGANTVTKDFLLFSQPFIHEGVLLSSSISGRRLYVHHLSEVPLSEVFTTREGNHVQRVDKLKVTLAGIEIDVTPKPDSAHAVPTAKVLSQIPTAAFTGSVNSRDKMVLDLLKKGKDANTAADFAKACACFEAAYALSMLLQASSMLRTLPLLVLLTKADVAGAMDADAAELALRLGSLRRGSAPLLVRTVSALDGRGLESALRWFAGEDDEPPAETI